MRRHLLVIFENDSLNFAKFGFQLIRWEFCCVAHSEPTFDFIWNHAWLAKSNFTFDNIRWIAVAIWQSDFRRGKLDCVAAWNRRTVWQPFIWIYNQQIWPKITVTATRHSDCCKTFSSDLTNYTNNASFVWLFCVHLMRFEIEKIDEISWKLHLRRIII